MINRDLRRLMWERAQRIRHLAGAGDAWDIETAELLERAKDRIEYLENYVFTVTVVQICAVIWITVHII